MSEKELIRPGRAADERGFALILAILALMLLTFLGLTMAATTSTELQIATNYRWSQQALYNAEAGLEAAKAILAPRLVTDWSGFLPAVRPGNWAFGTAAFPPFPVVNPRDYEGGGAGCTDRAGVGYGRVLTVGGVPYANVNNFGGQNLNGAFTIWIRRGVRVDATTGNFSDDPDQTAAIITAEGIAPFTGVFAAANEQAFARANQATRILETGFGLVTAQTNRRCQTGLAGQEGLAASGENFDPCSPITASGIAGAVGIANPNDTGVR